MAEYRGRALLALFAVLGFAVTIVLLVRHVCRRRPRAAASGRQRGVPIRPALSIHDAARGASIHWSGVSPDPWVFFCPNAGDPHGEGIEFGNDHPDPPRCSPDAVTYAGIHHYTLTDGHDLPPSSRAV